MSVSRHQVPLGTAKLWAKRLKSALAPSDFPAPLSLCQQSLAKMLGFEHWHELQKNLDETGVSPESPLANAAPEPQRPINTHTGSVARLGYDYHLIGRLEEGLKRQGGWILAGTARSGRTTTLQALAQTAHASDDHPLLVWDNDRSWPAQPVRVGPYTLDNATVIRPADNSSLAHREHLLASVAGGDLVVHSHHYPFDPVVWTAPHQRAYRMFASLNASSEWAILDRLGDYGIQEADLRDHQPVWWLGYQSLVSELCNCCAEPLDVDAFLSSFRNEVAKKEWQIVFKHLPTRSMRRRGTGCERCYRNYKDTERVGYGYQKALASWVKMDDAGWSAWHRFQKAGGLGHASEADFLALQFQGRAVVLDQEPPGQASQIEMALWRISQGRYDPQDACRLFGPHAVHGLVNHMGWT